MAGTSNFVSSGSSTLHDKLFTAATRNTRSSTGVCLLSLHTSQYTVANALKMNGAEQGVQVESRNSMSRQ
jgi:hypothetical protein